MSWTWCNGKFLDGPLAVSATDRGLTHGLGIFETVLARDGQPVVLDLHLARMADGVRRFGWDPDSISADLILPAITGLLARNDQLAGRARIRIALSAGEGDLRFIGQGRDALLWMTSAPAPESPESVTLVTAPFARNESSPLAGIKCASYAENLFALDHARKNGADEVLLFNTRGDLCEAAAANVFLVRDGGVMTPPLASGCLAGTMRARVMELCREIGTPMSEVTLTNADLLAAEAMFLTSATRGIVPVSGFDGRAFSECPGDLVERLRGGIAL